VDEILHLLNRYADQPANRPHLQHGVIGFVGRRGRDLRSAKLIMEDETQKVYRCTNCFNEKRIIGVWKDSLTFL